MQREPGYWWYKNGPKCSWQVVHVCAASANARSVSFFGVNSLIPMDKVDARGGIWGEKINRPGEKATLAIRTK